MEDQEEHVEISLEEEKKGSDEPKIEVVDEKIEKKAEEKPEISPDEGIQAMKKRLEAAEQARLDAEKRAREAAERAQRATSETKDANYQLVVNAIETVKGRADAIKQAYSNAMASGDFDKAAQLQEALAVNAQQLSELKRGKKAMKEEMERKEKAAPETPERSNEPMIDQLARQVSPRSASWLRENRDTLDNDRMIRRMFRAHEDAVDEGIAADSDEYFAFIENRLGLTKVVEEAPAPKRAPPPPSAPVTRGGQRPNVVRLTRDQVEMAKMMGMSESDYAKNMVALQREGKIGH